MNGNICDNDDGKDGGDGDEYYGVNDDICLWQLDRPLALIKYLSVTIKPPAGFDNFLLSLKNKDGISMTFMRYDDDSDEYSGVNYDICLWQLNRPPALINNF